MFNRRFRRRETLLKGEKNVKILSQDLISLGSELKVVGDMQQSYTIDRFREGEKWKYSFQVQPVPNTIQFQLENTVRFNVQMEHIGIAGKKYNFLAFTFLALALGIGSIDPGV